MVKSKGLTFLDDNKCVGCIGEEWCPVRKYSLQHNLEIECTCLECLLKYKCSTACPDFDDYIKSMYEHDPNEPDFLRIVKTENGFFRTPLKKRKYEYNM